MSFVNNLEEWKKLNSVTNVLAAQIMTIRKAMEGKGISPADTPIVMADLLEIEEKLRILGSNLDNPVPFSVK